MGKVKMRPTVRRFEKGFCAYNIVQDRWMMQSSGYYAGECKRYVAAAFALSGEDVKDPEMFRVLWANARKEGWRVFPIVARLVLPADHRAGGHARAAKLSPARRSEIARKAANARWNRRRPRTHRSACCGVRPRPSRR